MRPRSARYPCRSLPPPDSTPSISFFTASLQRLQVFDRRADVVRRHRGLERRHHVGDPFTIFAPGSSIDSRRYSLSAVTLFLPPAGPSNRTARGSWGSSFSSFPSMAWQLRNRHPSRRALHAREAALFPASPLRAPARDPTAIGELWHHDQLGASMFEWPVPEYTVQDPTAARPVRLHQKGGHPAGDHVHLHPEIRQVESVEDVGPWRG